MSLSHNYYTVLYQWKSRLRRSFGRSVGLSILSYEIQQLHSTTSENGTIWPESRGFGNHPSFVKTQLNSANTNTNQWENDEWKSGRTSESSRSWFHVVLARYISKFKCHVGIIDDYTEENIYRKLLNTIRFNAFNY